MPPAPNPELRQQVIAIYKRKSFLSLHALSIHPGYQGAIITYTLIADRTPLPRS